MAFVFGKEVAKSEILTYFPDPKLLAGATPCMLVDGKADGIKMTKVRTGSGLEFNIVSGRSMDISECHYKGIPLSYLSATGITSPAYYEEEGTQWLRSFYGGLLTTCGLTYAGPPCNDEGKKLGLHGRISNSGAEDLGIEQRWLGDEFLITLKGTMREAETMGENMTLTRVISTRLGQKGFRIDDEVENRGFEPQPLMILYHFNFGYPLLSESAQLLAPFTLTTPRDREARADEGIEQCRRFETPVTGYQEKVFFHSLAAANDGSTTVALVNSAADKNRQAFGIVLRFNINELPEFTEWKMMRKGCYVIGLEPGTVNSVSRADLRSQGKLPLIEGQSTRSTHIEFEVIDSENEVEDIRAEIDSLVTRSPLAQK